MIRPCAVLLLLALQAPAHAQAARTAADCDRIQSPHEFNLCLASLSPVRGRSKAGRAAAPVRAAQRRSGRAGPAVATAPGGRKRMSFEVR